MKIFLVEKIREKFAHFNFTCENEVEKKIRENTLVST